MVVELGAVPLGATRGLAAAGRARSIAAAQRRLEARVLAAVPTAEVTWRYGRVLAGLAVALPDDAVPRLRSLAGVAAVYPSYTYRALGSRGPAQIGAPLLWGAGLTGTTGRGMKIGIIDDGVDPSHPYFDPSGFAPPPGFPRGDTRYTSGKIIVARAFAPPRPAWRYASVPFDPELSEHGTHVAGIAAGDPGVRAPTRGGRPALELSGVAPLAYIGNYKALTIPSGFGLNGNSPELVAAIEAAVEDGMDVINLSLGEPEIAPERDIVAKALDGAAAAGVVPVVAAGNEFEERGAGSIGSPGTAARAITVAAVTGTDAVGVRARVLGPGEVPTALRSFGLLPIGVSMPPGPRSVEDADLCSAPPALDGSLVLVQPGGCAFLAKTRRAAAAGAAGLVVPQDPPLPAGSFPLPVLSAPPEIFDELTAFEAASAPEDVVLEVRDEAVAVTAPGGVIAEFSSGGPTPLGLAAKPDISAPGVDVLSSVPRSFGLYDLLSGTSMATPHVAGAAALLLERHPAWTVSQVKSALVTTGAAVWENERHAVEASPARQGGGLADLAQADAPLLFAEPQSLALGLLDVSHGEAQAGASIRLDDAGGGAGTWAVSVVERASAGGAQLTAPGTVDIPGTLSVTVRAGRGAREGERAGFVVLRRDDVQRRIPFWFRVTRPRLPGEHSTLLRASGTFTATTVGGPSRVDRYRYPDTGARLRGPEKVFRVAVRRPVANFGVAVIAGRGRATIEPRVVTGADENRVVGPAGLPGAVNPYLDIVFLGRTPIAGALHPTPGTYSIVFDSPERRGAPFTFRFWIDDVTPPRIALLERRGRILQARVTDTGSGVVPTSVTYSLDGRPADTALYDPDTGIARIDVRQARRGRHTLELRAYDRQELKNTENAGPILPNTRVLRTRIVVP